MKNYEAFLAENRPMYRRELAEVVDRIAFLEQELTKASGNAERLIVHSLISEELNRLKDLVQKSYQKAVDLEARTKAPVLHLLKLL